jgi:REP element-mobilizing transposase RayT
MEFRFFDPAAETDITQGRLPHWEQFSAYYFITWRTADSIPQKVLDAWHGERADWLRIHGIPPEAEDWQRELEMLPREQHAEFYRRFTSRWHDLLDEGHGDCVLRRADLRQIVEDSLLHFEGTRHVLEAFVVMPNHVHVLAGIPGRGELKALCRSWKHFTARQINAALRSEGQFWQWESFDHLVRSPASLEKFREYILKNPAKALLREGAFTVWSK